MPFETKYVCDTCQPPYTFYKVTEQDPRKVKCKTPSCPQCRQMRAAAKLHMKVSGDVKESVHKPFVPTPIPPYKYSCNKCYNKFYIEHEDRVKLESVNCPVCRSEDTMYLSDRTPVLPSQSSRQFTQAFDKTAELVMQDYQMTDVNMGTSLRSGDNCVPKLPPELERKVDAVFDGKAKNNVMGMAGDKLTTTLMNQINAGAFRNYGDPVARQQADPTLAPKINVIDHYTGKPH